MPKTPLRLLTVFLITVCFSPPVSACFYTHTKTPWTPHGNHATTSNSKNSWQEKYVGERWPNGPFIVSFDGQKKDRWRDVINDIEKIKHPNQNEKQDLAVAYAHTGRTEEALVILKNLEEVNPTGPTASNLGSLYELLGEDELALEFIQKSIERNNVLHEGTEWLHVAILKSKINLKKDPSYLVNNSVAGFNFGSGSLPEFPQINQKDNHGQPVNFAEGHKALSYQIEERLDLYPKEDPVLSDLIYDFAQLDFLLNKKPINVDLAKKANNTLRRKDASTRILAMEKSVERDIRQEKLAQIMKLVGVACFAFFFGVLPEVSKIWSAPFYFNRSSLVPHATYDAFSVK